MSSIVRSDVRFYECSWVGQFRAVDEDKAKLFAQAVADQMQEFGVHDVGYDVRVMPRDVLTDEDARTTLLSHVRPESADKVPHPWDQGLWLFPEDHVLHDYEVLAKESYDRTGNEDHRHQFDRTLKALEAGDGKED